MTNPRLEMAWLLYCVNEGYNEADRASMKNWMVDPLSQLHPDDVVTRQTFLDLADDALSMLRAHFAGVAQLLRGMADDRKPGPVQDLAYKKADAIDDMLGVGSYVE